MRPVTGWRTSRDSSSVSAGGLLVLGLGALVLLAGLSTPAPQSQDMISVANLPIPASTGEGPHWIAALGMVAMALLGLGARKRAQSLFQYASTAARA